MIDNIINAKIKDNISLSVPLYLMMSYAYYEEDKPIASDSTFDKVSKLMLENWKKIKHPHKKLINLDNLKAGTYLGKYPTIVKDTLEMILTKTTSKFSKIIKKIKPDLIVIHGDRVEALSCALTGSLNHILTAHIEGGEISGTIDDTIRHAVTKLSHIHFVGSSKARQRVLKMGEIKKSIYNIGSPDLDVILKKILPII